ASSWPCPTVQQTARRASGRTRRWWNVPARAWDLTPTSCSTATWPGTWNSRCAWPRRYARTMCAGLKRCLPPDDYEGYAELRRRVQGMAVATGEHEYTRWGFAELLSRKCCHIIQPDLAWCGGISEARRIAALASAHGVPVIPHAGGLQPWASTGSRRRRPSPGPNTWWSPTAWTASCARSIRSCAASHNRVTASSRRATCPDWA